MFEEKDFNQDFCLAWFLYTDMLTIIEIYIHSGKFPAVKDLNYLPTDCTMY